MVLGFRPQSFFHGPVGVLVMGFYMGCGYEERHTQHRVSGGITLVTAPGM